MNKFRFVITRPVARDGWDVYLYAFIDDVGYHCIVDKDGFVVIDKKNQNKKSFSLDYKPKPLFSIDGRIDQLMEGGFLQMFADALGEKGIYPQATNKDKIKWEAISEEKEKELNYFKETLNNLLNKMKIY